MNFNDEQRQAIYSQKPIVVISAGAGSGKTRVLTERFVYLCEQKLNERLGKHASSTIGATVEEIVAITFTEKAAREMKDRIRGRIEEMRLTVDTRYLNNEQQFARKFWQEQKEALDTAAITTFHSFCHKLLHEFAFKADVTPNFTVLDDVQAKLIQIQIFEEMFDSPEYHRKWKRIYDYYTRGQLQDAIKNVYGQMKEVTTTKATFLEFFDSETIVQLQLEAIVNDQKNLISHFYTEARPFVMDLDENEKGLKKIIEHFSEINDCSFSNPNNVFAELVSVMPKRISSNWKESNPPLYELYEQLFKPLKETWKKLKEPSEVELEEIKEIINLFAQMLTVFHEKYDVAKRERAAMDFSDLQQKAIALLEDEEVQKSCRNKYRHMMVDEFQDTNQLQMSMLTLIKPSFQFVVGDGKQSIYRFRGADVSLMKELVLLSKEGRESDFINMSTNYRTCASIIEFVNVAFNEIMGKEESDLDPSYKITYNDINSHRNRPEEQKCRVELLTIAKDSEEEGLTESKEAEEKQQSEYEVIANRMLQLIKETKPIVAEGETWRAPTWHDFAILIQTRTKLTKLEKALKDKRIPYVVYGGIGFYEKQEIRDMISILNWINRPWEPLYILSLLRSPLFGLSVEDFLTIDECLEEEVTLATYIYEGIFLTDEKLEANLTDALKKLKHFYEQWIPFTPQVPMKEYLQQLFIKSGLKTMLMLERNNLQQVKNVEKLIDILSGFQSASLDERLNQLKQLAVLSDKEGEAEVELAEGNMVHIMTVHASKGLEFPIVFLPDLAKGPRGDSGTIRFDKDVRIAVQYEKEKENEPLKSPDKKSSPAFERIKQIAKDQAVEEAKRLFYVAVTRAKDYLVLSTVDKPAKDSWYDMLLKVIEKENKLQDLMLEMSEVTEEKEWQETGDIYDPGSIKEIEHASSHVSFSVSEIMTYMNDPLKYYYKYIIKIEDDWLDEEKEKRAFQENEQFLSGATLGTIVHRACELLDNGYDLDEAKLEALSAIDNELEKDDYENALNSLVDQYQEINSLQLGEPFANEWIFSVEIDGAEIIGEIDKIVEKDGRYHLIDLKTNKAETFDELLKYYTPQLYLYKLAFEKVHGQKVEQMSLFFIRAGLEGFKTISFDPNVEEEIRKVIKKLCYLKQYSVTKEDFLLC